MNITRKVTNLNPCRWKYACCFQLWWGDRDDLDGGGSHDGGFRDGNGIDGDTDTDVRGGGDFRGGHGGGKVMK